MDKFTLYGKICAVRCGAEKRECEYMKEGEGGIVVVDVAE